MRFFYFLTMFLLCISIAATDVFSLNAPVTPEMLLSLRAHHGMDVSKDPLNVTPVVEDGQIVSLERKENKATLDSAESYLARAFDINICSEGAPHTQFSKLDYVLDYNIEMNERLVDALDRFVEASNEHISWRLLDGRLVLSVSSKDDSFPIGDRMMQVDIDAATIGEALSQLEDAYNEQYTDVPFAFYTRDHTFFHSNAITGNRFRAKGQDTLRNIVISLLNQWDPAQASYSLSARHAPVHKKHARQYYYDNNLYYYYLNIQNIKADEEKEKLFRQGFVDEGFEERYHWGNAQFPEMTQRLMNYFDRIYPEWAAAEQAALAQKE